MGTGVEWYAAPEEPGGEVQLDRGRGRLDAEQRQPERRLRYMNDPTEDGYSVDNYKNYPKQTEVHGSSGIANNAFYLMAKGGKNKTSGIEVKDGIGMEKGLKIFGRALTTT